MQENVQTAALRELEGLVGRQTALDQVHGTVRRAAQSVGRGIEYGMCLVSCADEFQGELRNRFERDVARPLASPLVQGTRRTFTISNLGGRIEPGAVAVANDHFTIQSRHEGAKLLVIEIAAHVGMRTDGHEVVYGEVDRFGKPSDCCAALKMLLLPPLNETAVRYSWLEQLRSFFGSRRLEALRLDPGPFNMIKVAAIHAVLQAETVLADLFRDPPATETHVLVVPLVAIDQKGPEDAIVVGAHHLFAKQGNLDVVHGAGLRTTPEALQVDRVNGRLLVTSTDLDPAPLAASLTPIEEHAPAPSFVPTQATPEITEHLDEAREELQRFEQRPHLARVYARPLLRGLLQGLSLVAPEVALAAMAVEGAGAVARTHHLRKVLASGPSHGRSTQGPARCRSRDPTARSQRGAGGARPSHGGEQPNFSLAGPRLQR